MKDRMAESKMPEDVAQNPLPDHWKRELRTGFVNLWRCLGESELWRERREFSLAEAYIDIVFQVRWKPQAETVPLKGGTVICRQGESLNSLATWAARWGVSKGRARTMLKSLEKMGYVRHWSAKKTSRTAVCHYKWMYGEGSKTVRNGLESKHSDSSVSAASLCEVFSNT